MTLTESQRGYRRFAPVYDLVFGIGLQQGRRVSVAALDCRPGDRILEVGVGSGLALPLYPPHVAVTGIDTSEEMLARARRRVERGGLTHVEALLQMDAGHMAFEDASFDKAVVMFAVSGMPDPVGVIAQMQRVCKPGGTLVIANHFRSSRPVLRVFDGLLAPIHRLLCYRPDIDVEAFVAEAHLDVIDTRSANLFGYSTVLVCRSHPPAQHALTRTAGAPAGRADCGGSSDDRPRR